MNKRNDFICIGAIHVDHIFKLKQENYYKNRTNPINNQEILGGVAYNIAKILSFLNQKTLLYSLNINSNIKKELKKNGIIFKSISNNIHNRFYASILNNEGKMLFGLANMDDYEKLENYRSLNIFKDKNIILDLNLPKSLINSVINSNFKNNYICICGTSAHKVYKIKTLLNKIDVIILNKKEILILTNKKTIKDSMNFLIKKNKNLTIIITNGKNAVNAYFRGIIYTAHPPLTKIQNENGAGDALTAVFNYFFCHSYDLTSSLNKSISAGSLQTSGYTTNNNKYLNKINKMSKNIKFKLKKLL